MSNNKKLVFPSVFTFTRSIEPGIGIFYAVDKDGNKTPITKQVNRLRATFSGHKQSNDGKKDSEGLAQGNIHMVESAYVPVGYDQLQLEFSFKVINNALTSGASNGMDTKIAFENFVSAYKDAGGINYIAKEYIMSLLSGHFLWRNKKLMEDVTINISANKKEYNFKLLSGNDLSNVDKSIVNDINELAEYFAKGLVEENHVSTFIIKASGAATEGQQVFPSQEFIENKSDTESSRVLATTKINQDDVVIFTSEKLGNALRRIDRWYADDATIALPIEPLGIDREYNIARRHANKNDFYKICENNLYSMIEELESGSLTPDMHFVFGCLVRGGVYNGEGKAKDKKANDKKSKK